MANFRRPEKKHPKDAGVKPEPGEYCGGGGLVTCPHCGTEKIPPGDYPDHLIECVEAR